MIYAIKCVRYFMIIGLCLYGSSATAMLKLKLNDKSSTNKSISFDALSLPRTNFIAHILSVPTAVGDYLHTIDLSPYQTMLEGSIANNPKLSIACAAACVLIVAACAAKKSISAERWQQIVELLNEWADLFIDKCYGIMPVWMQTTSTFTKTMCLQPLAAFTQSYIKYNTIHAVLSILCLVTGGVTGYTKSSVSLATMCALVGANQLGFNRLEAKIDANQAETNKNFETVRSDIVDVRKDIENLGKDVTNQIKGVNVNVDTRAQEISNQINNLEQTIENKLKELGDNSQESIEGVRNQINELTVQIDEVKKSFTKTLENKIELLSKELQQKMKSSDTKRDDDARYLNEQLEGVTKDLTELKSLVETFNNNSNVQSQKIENLAATVTQDISQFTGSINQKIENLSGDVTGLKSQLNIVQETSKGINDAMQNQAAKLEDIEFKIANVSTEVQENIKSIREDINKFNETAKEDAAQATEKLVQQIDELSEKNKKFAEKLNQELLVKIEEFIKETKVEKEALKKEVKESIESARDNLQVKVDDIQKQQNICAEMLNALQDSNKNQDLKVTELIILAKSNQEEISGLGITVQVQAVAINEKLDKLQREMVVVKQELLNKIDEVVQETSTIKKLLNVIDEKEDAKYQQMSTVLEKTSDLSGHVNIVHSLVASVKVGSDENSEFIKRLDMSVKEFKKEFFGLNTSIDSVYRKIENFEKEQAAQQQKIAEISSNQSTQGSQLDKLLESDDQKTKQMQDLMTKYDKLLAQNEDILKGQKNTDEKIHEYARRGDRRFDEIKEGQKKVVNALNQQCQLNPQRLTNARKKNKELLGWADLSNQSGIEDNQNNANVLRHIVKNKNENGS